MSDSANIRKSIASGQCNPIDNYGLYVSGYDLDDHSAGIEAILEDDIFVKVLSWTRVRVGAAGTGEGTTSSERWEWEVLHPMPKGTYRLILSCRDLVKAEVERRKSNGMSWKRFWSRLEFFSMELFYDDDFCKHILEEGLVNYLAKQPSK